MDSLPSVDPAALREEDRRIRTLQWAVSLAVQSIVQAPLSYSQAVAALNGTRALALWLFPGKAFAFDVIYRPRLQRAIAQRFRVN